MMYFTVVFYSPLPYHINQDQENSSFAQHGRRSQAMNAWPDHYEVEISELVYRRPYILYIFFCFLVGRLMRAAKSISVFISVMAPSSLSFYAFLRTSAQRCPFFWTRRPFIKTCEQQHVLEPFCFLRCGHPSFLPHPFSPVTRLLKP